MYCLNYQNFDEIKIIDYNGGDRMVLLFNIHIYIWQELRQILPACPATECLLTERCETMHIYIYIGECGRSIILIAAGYISMATLLSRDLVG